MMRSVIPGRAVVFPSTPAPVHLLAGPASPGRSTSPCFGSVAPGSHWAEQEERGWLCSPCPTSRPALEGMSTEEGLTASHPQTMACAEDSVRGQAGGSQENWGFSEPWVNLHRGDHAGLSQQHLSSQKTASIPACKGRE